MPKQTETGTVLFYPGYVDLLGGDITCALILSQLVEWYMPDKHGFSKLTIKKNDGTMWMAKSCREWQERFGLSRSQSRRSLHKLRKLGLVELRIYKVNGTPTTHIRFPWVHSGHTLAAAPTTTDLQQQMIAIRQQHGNVRQVPTVTTTD